MTREELINFGELFLEVNNDSKNSSTYKFIDTALKLFKQEPCEDCIARQPLIDNWNSCADMLMGKGDSEVVMGWIFDALSVTPTNNIKVLDMIRAEIKDWQTDIHDNEYDAESHDFVFERIYEIIDEHKNKENEE